MINKFLQIGNIRKKSAFDTSFKKMETGAHELEQTVRHIHNIKRARIKISRLIFAKSRIICAIVTIHRFTD